MSSATCFLRCILEQAPVFFNLRLLGRDSPDQDAEHGLRDDVRARIPDLLASRRRHAGDPEHLDDVHEGVGQPGDDREPASVPGEISNRPLLVVPCHDSVHLRCGGAGRRIERGRGVPGAVGC